MANQTAKAEQRPGDFVTPREWIEAGRGGSIVPTEAALEWFIRCNRPALIESGEFIPGRGARASMIGPGFDALLVKILRTQASPRGV